MEVNRLYLGDCLELMADIEDQSIDMILCDLPYGTTACRWDTIIPFEPLWAHYKRIIKPRGAIVLTGSQPFTSRLVMSNIEWFKYEWIWDKVMRTGHLNSKKAPMRQHENVLVFCQLSTTYYPQMEKRKKHVEDRQSKRAYPYDVKSGAYGSIKIKGKTKADRLKAGAMPGTIIKINALNTSAKEKTGHPTQKPVPLFAYLIKTYTNPGMLVLDNCIGSGTTAIAAIETGRNWIGIEKDEEYYNIATKRIQERLKQPFLPGIVETKPKPKQAELAL